MAPRKYGFGILLAALLAGAQAQDPKVSISPRPKLAPAPAEGPAPRSIRVRSDLVLIPVTVTDPLTRIVSGLEKENFRLFEENVEQEITQFSSEDAPLSMGVVFDMSGSMGKKLQKSRQAVAELMKMANPEDEFFLVRFNDHPEMALPFTRDAEEIQSRLTFTESKGRTALLDAVYLSMSTMKKASNPRKALVIISDGGDNSSRYTEREIRNMVREGDTQLYAMGIFEPVAARGRTAEELSGPGLLSQMCEQTGGRHFAIENLAELPDVASKIATELHHQYVLGYAPKNREHDGKYRRVKVELVPPKGLPPLRAFWRLGYISPVE